MNHINVAILFFSCFAAQAFAQDTLTTDPPELHSRREAYERDMQRAAAPIISNYLRSLEPLKQQFNREGKLQAALAVDNEIKRVTKELETAIAAPTTKPITGSSKLAIVSATYGESASNRVVDITDHVRRALEAGQAT